MSYFLYFCLWLICCFILSVIIRVLNGGESLDLDLFEDDEPFVGAIIVLAYVFSPITVACSGVAFIIVVPLFKYGIVPFFTRIVFPFMKKWEKTATNIAKKICRFVDAIEEASREKK